MHENIQKYTIRATAGLLYWFAIETGMCEPSDFKGFLRDVQLVNEKDLTPIGGSLGILGVDEEIASEGHIPLGQGYNFTVRTNTPRFDSQQIRHFNWNLDMTKYRISKVFQVSNMVTQKQRAVFEQIEPINFSTIPNDVEIMDPWLINNFDDPSAEPWDWVQLSEFKPMVNLLDNNCVSVFRNQGDLDDLDGDLPIYYLQAPAIRQINENTYEVFNGWYAKNSSGITISGIGIFEENGGKATTATVFTSDVESVALNEYMMVSIEDPYSTLDANSGAISAKAKEYYYADNNIYLFSAP